ncbi:hypothetical protein Poli38472_007217 [Pythium oligandrum]|uniref:Uncharacterized protein n=1 Tax=Pythium oligandrum TaxID=41045 RepID=A0A8K1FGU4_PYTOL|nr:hypothetical protein Poli38472_007217 [Pythium oligandrum]|eukprot:TMW59072.1 hypothetical protein Poli38472_007217 [Pythium oligandrum]
MAEPKGPTAGSAGRTARGRRALTPEEEEQRRKINRESMQRSRLRQRGEIARMRVELRALEKQLATATEIQRQTIIQSVNPRLVEFIQLGYLTKQLQDENFWIQQELTKRWKGYERIERVVEDFFTEKVDDMDAALAAEEEQEQDDNFEPITEAAACELIRQCCQAVQLFDRATLDGDDAVVCFGWKLRYQIENGCSIRFLFSKTFPHVYPAQAMDKGWTMYRQIEINNVKSLRVLRLETIQEINEDTHVMLRDIAHPLDPGIILRTILLRFRINTERGFIGGRMAMNPTTPPRAAHIRYADVTSFTEFGYVDPSRPDLPGCHVKFGGCVDYRTTRELSSRLLTILSTAVQMEQLLMQPLTSLLPNG